MWSLTLKFLPPIKQVHVLHFGDDELHGEDGTFESCVIKTFYIDDDWKWRQQVQDWLVLCGTVEKDAVTVSRLIELNVVSTVKAVNKLTVDSFSGYEISTEIKNVQDSQ